MTDKTDVAAVDSSPVAGAADTADRPPREPTRGRLTRRKFLVAGATMAGAATVGAGAYLATRPEVQVAILGAGIRGGQHAEQLSTFRYFMSPFGRVVAICDVELSKAQKLCDATWPDADAVQDYRKVLARPDVEAVIICPCDHWHAQMAIDAMRAGKAVYCEKPLTLTIAESKQVVEVAEQTGVVFQVGTQQRSMQNFRIICDLLKNGRLGELRKVVISLDEQMFEDVLCKPDPSKQPDDLDWDLWLGPTEMIDYCPQRHRMWGNWFDYCGGEITGWGSHHLDIGMWAMGGDVWPVSIDARGELPDLDGGFDVPRTFAAVMQYTNGVQVEMQSLSRGSRGVLLEGTKGRVFANRGKVTGKPYEELQSNPLPPDAMTISDHPAGAYGKTSMMWHYIDFFRCIASGGQPIADVQSAHRVTTALHLCNISIRLGRPLEFDPQSEQIVGDEEAAGMMDRPRRSPFLI